MRLPLCMPFKLQSNYTPSGDQPAAIAQLTEAVLNGDMQQTLLGVTGSGKTFTIANLIQNIQRPTLVLTHNKTLVAQLYGEFKQFFPDNAVGYFVSYYDYYQPEAYLPTSGVYIEKDLSINEELDKLRLQATAQLLSGRRDIIIVASVSCIYGMGNPTEYENGIIRIHQGQILSRQAFLHALVNSLYHRSVTDFDRGAFRVNGDTIDIRLPYVDYGYRVTFFGDEIEAIEGHGGQLLGVPTGFSGLDEITHGLHGGQLIIVAARPGMGKTALTISMARNMAVEFNIPVAFFSLEMSSIQLITRLISSETGLSSEKLRTGNLEKFEWEQLNLKVSALENAPLFIDDTPSLSIFDLRAKARRLSSQHGIKLIVIDYLQLMTAGGSNKNGNREQEISTISRNLKALAKELDVPVIALSQLSRAVETRGGSKRPILSDLRESGAIEQDADIVSFIYRPEYYKIDEWDDEERTPSAGQAEFIVAKHRNGGLNNIKLKFVSNLGKFENLDNFETPFEYQSKINKDSLKVNPDQAFESGGYREDNEDIPF